MLCNICGAEYLSPETSCPTCRKQSPVRILPPDQREDFNGLTIEQEEHGKTYFEQGEDYYKYENNGPNHRVYIHRVNINSPLKSVLTVLTVGAVLALLVLVAMPLAILLIAAFGFNWLFGRLNSR